ncbi:MAG: toll/interleukin-1 receptor domain-containing protein [Desulfobacterales bacterium]|nr:toll/interleukin-1 receptor domain-containing protein [Desulfobacterales bacterium]
MIKSVKVFISYAGEDYNIAKKLHDDLKKAGIEPWIDKENIVPGQNLNYVIRTAILGSSYFLALLSSNSVSKRGYFHTEIDMALEILRKCPKSDIYFLPVRLDECQLPNEELDAIAPCDLFPSYDDGLKKILRVFYPLTPGCPSTLGELIQTQTDRDCARLLQRSDLICEIKRHLLETPAPKPHYVILYGQQQSGKSYILSQLSDDVSDKHTPLLISTKSGDITRLNSFLFNLISQLTNKSNAWAKQKGGSATFDDPAWSDFEEGKEEASFYKYWNHLCQAGERMPVVMFDEIDRLLDQPGELDNRILIFLKDFVGDPANGYFILSGSERIQYERIQAFSSLIGNGMPFRVRYFEEETVSSVFSAVRQYFCFESDSIKMIYALWDGHPRFLWHVYHEIVSIINNFPGKQTIEKSDIEPLANKVIDRTEDFLQLLLQRLSDNELYVLKLITKKTYDPINGFELNIEKLFENGFDIYLEELFELAREKPDSPVNHDILTEGVNGLKKREWIEELKNKELFRLKLGILPYWIRRGSINLDEIHKET